jgi:hypothetical protein
MCFSAEASFTVSGILAITGGIAIKKAGNAPQRLFAAIPVMFAFQQLLEGFLWEALCSGGSPDWQDAAMYGYLVFAWIIWPMHIPVSMFFLERDLKRRRMLRLNVIFGLIVAAWLAGTLLFRDVSASVGDHHIAYDPDTTLPVTYLIAFLYMLATTVSPFLSSLKRMKWIGAINLLAVLLSLIWFNDYFISVWCYLAAVISVLVVWVLYGLNRKGNDRHFPQQISD